MCGYDINDLILFFICNLVIRLTQTASGETCSDPSVSGLQAILALQDREDPINGAALSTSSVSETTCNGGEVPWRQFIEGREGVLGVVWFEGLGDE